MKYINNKTFEPTPGAATRYLNKLGIYDIESFLYKPKPSDYISPWSLNNMEEMVTALNEVFTKNKKIFLQVDSDTDGITSSAIFYNFFTSIFPNAQIEYRVHEGKEHGVILDTIPVDAQVIAVPDAGSNQLDEQEALAYQGRTVLIMDHHVVNHFQDLKNVIIVNNQTSELYYNKNLSGAGVVYKVIEAYCQKYLNNEPLYKNYEDLAALGIIADCMDCRTLDNNAIVMNGLNHIHNPMLAQFLEKQSAGGLRIKNPKNPTKIDIAFYVAPFINAVIRSGTLEEKTQLFESFIGADKESWRFAFEAAMMPQALPTIEGVVMDAGIWWDTLAETNGWKLQRNKVTGHGRIIDPQKVRKAWGSVEEMVRSFEKVRNQL